MTVAELITALQQLPGETPVAINVTDNEGVVWITDKFSIKKQHDLPALHPGKKLIFIHLAGDDIAK